MKQNKVTDFMDKMVKGAKKNSPAILTGLGVLGLALTAVEAYRAGLKTVKIMEEHKLKMEEIPKKDKEEKRKVTMETVKKMTPVILPAAIMGISSAACIIGANSVSSKRVAVLSAAYNISERTVRDLNEKMQETLGEKKTQSIKDAIIKEKLHEDGPTPPENQIIVTGNGDVLCKDSYSGRYFRSNAQKIKQAINQLSADVIQEMYVSLNDFYYLLNLPQIPLGEDFGWNIDDSQRGILPITVSAILNTEDVPCLCIDYDARLREDYRNLH